MEFEGQLEEKNLKTKTLGKGIEEKECVEKARLSTISGVSDLRETDLGTRASLLTFVS